MNITVHLVEHSTSDMMAEIVGLCQDVLQFGHINLVVLNTSDSMLSFEALPGKILVCNNVETYKPSAGKTIILKFFH